MKFFRTEKYYVKQRSRFYGVCFPLLVLVGLLFLNPSTSFSQDYGLNFLGNETVKDKRTKLDLNHDGYYSFHNEFELSFRMRLRPGPRLSFGYVVRIIDTKGHNIDIIYNGPKSSSLQVVYGQELTNISLPDNTPEIFDNWTDIRLKIDLKNGTLQFNASDTTMVFSGIDFEGKVKILFGANDFASFKTIEVPAMNIKDIRILEKGKLKHHYQM